METRSRECGIRSVASRHTHASRHIVIVITTPSKETARLTRSNVCFCSFLTSLLVVIVPLFGMIKRARLDALFINIPSLIGMYCAAVLIIVQFLKVTQTLPTYFPLWLYFFVIYYVISKCMIYLSFAPIVTFYVGKPWP